MTKFELIKCCLRQKCTIEDDWHLTVFARWFYTLKIVICICFGLKHYSKERDWYRKEFVTVAMHSFERFYNYQWSRDDATYTIVTVGYGLLNWRYHEMSDGWL